MNRTGSNLLFLAIGAAVGAAVGYVAASDKLKERWLNDIGGLVQKIKGNGRAPKHEELLPSEEEVIEEA